MRISFGFRLMPVFRLTLLLMISITTAAQQGKYYSDIAYKSKVFGHDKTFRIYLPEQYATSVKRYPVIYFFHGWGGRHFKDDNALLAYDSIKKVVDKYHVILVMWDGNMEESNPRPYNIGYHKDIQYQIQMTDYFTELVNHIDSGYRTYSDRSHRGLIGFSMGGIMAYYLAGKYPHKVGAAVNFAGTPEFYIGYPDNHTLYPVRYTFRNLMEVCTRQYSGDSDILTYLNEEVRKGALWEGKPHEFISFKGGHMIDKPGETVVFESAVEFLCACFGKINDRPAQFSHYDLYSKFNVWDYSVKSTKNEHGYLFLRNASESGFGIYTHQWLPDGPVIPEVITQITTAPVYIPGKTYRLLTLDASSQNSNPVESQIQADNKGCITLSNIQGDTEFGISDIREKPELIAAGFELNNGNRYISPGRNTVRFRLFNRGGDRLEGAGIKINIMANDSAIILENPDFVQELENGSRILWTKPVLFDCRKTPPAHGEPFQIRFTINTESATTDVIVPVLFDAPYFPGFKVDDGLMIRDKAFGQGNRNGMAEPGEKILLYYGQNRLRLYTNDRYVVHQLEELADEQLPSIWEDSYTLSSVVSISNDCPAGHMINFTASYETVTYNPIERKVHWGTIQLRVGEK